MTFFEKYIKLRSIIKKWDLEKIKTKNIFADWRKLKCQEEFQWADNDPVIQLNNSAECLLNRLLH